MPLNSSVSILNNIINKQYVLKTGTSSTSAARIHWTSTGIPAAGGISTAIGGQICTKDTIGALPFYNSEVDKETKISSLSMYTDVPSYFLLIDRLWECSVTVSGTAFDITSAVPQSINSIAWPLRDNNQTLNGEGVYIAVVSNGAWSAGTVTFSISYTNSLGISGRIGNSILNLTANPTNGSLTFISLDIGDLGVKSVESITLNSTATAGTFHLIAFRKLCYYIQNNSVNSFIGDFRSHPLPRLFNDCCLTFITQAQASAAQTQPFSGYIEYASG